MKQVANLLQRKQNDFSDRLLAIFYCSPDYDFEQLATVLHARFAGINLIGYTTAGEITPVGYLNGILKKNVKGEE